MPRISQSTGVGSAQITDGSIVDADINASAAVTWSKMNTSTVGFYGATAVARPSAYTQTYATASRTHSNLTAATVATTAAGLTLFGFAQAQADALPVAVNALVADVANVKQVLNNVIDDLQANGLLQ